MFRVYSSCLATSSTNSILLLLVIKVLTSLLGYCRISAVGTSLIYAPVLTLRPRIMIMIIMTGFHTGFFCLGEEIIDQGKHSAAWGFGGVCSQINLDPLSLLLVALGLWCWNTFGLKCRGGDYPCPNVKTLPVFYGVVWQANTSDYIIITVIYVHNDVIIYKIVTFYSREVSWRPIMCLAIMTVH